jgi:hypothetical protein
MRSGYGSPALYFVFAVGFGALVLWALVQRDWTVAVIAAVMIAVAGAGAMFVPKLKAALEASQAEIDAGKEGRHG